MPHPDRPDAPGQDTRGLVGNLLRCSPCPTPTCPTPHTARAHRRRRLLVGPRPQQQLHGLGLAVHAGREQRREAVLRWGSGGGGVVHVTAGVGHVTAVESCVHYLGHVGQRAAGDTVPVQPAPMLLSDMPLATRLRIACYVSLHHVTGSCRFPAPPPSRISSSLWAHPRTCRTPSPLPLAAPRCLSWPPLHPPVLVKGPTHPVRCLLVCPLLKQQLHHLLPPVEGGHVQRRVAVLRGGTARHGKARTVGSTGQTYPHTQARPCAWELPQTWPRQHILSISQGLASACPLLPAGRLPGWRSCTHVALVEARCLHPPNAPPHLRGRLPVGPRLQ